MGYSTGKQKKKKKKKFQAGVDGSANACGHLQELFWTVDVNKCRRYVHVVAVFVQDC